MLRSPRLVWLIVGWFAFGLILAVVPVSWLAPERSAWWRIIGRASGQLTSQTAGGRARLDLVRRLRLLTDDASRLEAENLRLQARLTELLEVEHDNSVLRGQLDFVTRQRPAFDLIFADIISRSPLTYLQAVTVNQGSNQGVTPGLLVVESGFVVGRVETVAQTSATIRLITASRSLIPITLVSSRVTGLLKGGLAGITAEDLPSDVTLTPGEPVVTSGLGQEVPADLPVGTVERVLSNQTDFIQRAAIHSPIKFSQLESLIILKPKHLDEQTPGG